MTKWEFSKKGMKRIDDKTICPYCGKLSVSENDDGILDCSNCTGGND